jgi:hypothetical protein
MGKMLRLRRDDVGDMAAGAAPQQGAHHGAAERAGATGNDDVTIAEVHDCGSLH